MIRNIDKSNETVGRRGRAEWEDLVTSAGETCEHLSRWFDTLAPKIRERPEQAVGLAIGAGFVLGGGLLTGLTFKIARASLMVGLRAAAAAASLRLLSRAAWAGRDAVDASSAG